MTAFTPGSPAAADRRCPRPAPGGLRCDDPAFGIAWPPLAGGG